jgi:DNA replication and repair protein RecF
MHYRSLSLHNIRSYGSFHTELSPHVNVVVGPNGSGKTNLLEALYVISTGRAYRSKDRDMLMHETMTAGIKTHLADKTVRSLQLHLKEDGRVQKQFSIHGAKKLRLTFAQKIPVALFDPDTLRMLTGSPTRRRDFMDDLLSRLQPQYSTILHRYERVLIQRNELLKNAAEGRTHSWRDQLFVWDIKLAELADYIVRGRRQLLAEMNKQLSERYSHIAQRPTELEAHYISSVHAENYQQTFLHKLESHIDHDVMRGFTSVGPHRDDLVMKINGFNASDVASRGEMRSIMLAFKLIEVELLRTTLGIAPLLLLDDVFSELDATRRKMLIKTMEDTQTVITTTDADIKVLPRDTAYIKLSLENS